MDGRRPGLPVGGLVMQIDELQVIRYTAPDEDTPKGKRRPAGYSLPENVAERFASFLENEEYLSLREELALGRTLLQKHLDIWEAYNDQTQALIDSGAGPKDIPAPPLKLSDLTACLTVIGNLMTKEHDLVYSPMNTVTVEAAAVFAISVAEIVNRYVADKEARAAVSRAIRDLLTSGRGFNVDMRVARRILNTNPADASDDEPQ